MVKHKNKIIAAAIIVFILIFSYYFGGNAPGLKEDLSKDVQSTDITTDKTEIKTEEKEVQENTVEIMDKKPEAPVTEEKNEKTVEIHKTEPPSEAEEPETSAVNFVNPAPIEPQDAVISDKEYTCTLSVSCNTVLDNISYLDPEKIELIAADGIIFPKQTVTFYEGESVFNLLLREMKKNKIHFEFVNTPVYNSAYIEGINNLYEFDCGELSGWMYKVNGWFPNYGCSRYLLKQGDVVEWVYTCNLGDDVGGAYAAGGQNE